MTDQPQSRGGGVFLVLAIILGTGIGAALGQSSAGVVGGVIVGSLIAIALWLRDRKRIGH